MKALTLVTVVVSAMSLSLLAFADGGAGETDFAPAESLNSSIGMDAPQGTHEDMMDSHAPDARFGGVAHGGGHGGGWGGHGGGHGGGWGGHGGGWGGHGGGWGGHGGGWGWHGGGPWGWHGGWWHGGPWGWGAGVVIDCWASNASGGQFEARGYGNPDAIQQRALNYCYNVSSDCQPEGCHPL